MNVLVVLAILWASFVWIGLARTLGGTVNDVMLLLYFAVVASHVYSAITEAGA